MTRTDAIALLEENLQLLKQITENDIRLGTACVDDLSLARSLPLPSTGGLFNYAEAMLSAAENLARYIITAKGMSCPTNSIN